MGENKPWWASDPDTAAARDARSAGCKRFEAGAASPLQSTHANTYLGGRLLA